MELCREHRIVAQKMLLEIVLSQNNIRGPYEGYERNIATYYFQ